MKTPADLIRDWIREAPERTVVMLADITGISKSKLYAVLKGEHFSSVLALKLGKAIAPELVAEAIRDTDEHFADMLDQYKGKEKPTTPATD